jgi:c-di-GMP-binding flagellar brake protein YcgR
MPEPKPERRKQKRLSVTVPITIKSEQGALQTTGCTRDLSGGGIFLYSDSRFSEGSELEIVMILPKEMTGGEKRWVCCRGPVVRVEENDEGRFGVAASILSMEILPEIGG